MAHPYKLLASMFAKKLVGLLLSKWLKYLLFASEILWEHSVNKKCIDLLGKFYISGLPINISFTRVNFNIAFLQFVGAVT